MQNLLGPKKKIKIWNRTRGHQLWADCKAAKMYAHQMKLPIICYFSDWISSLFLLAKYLPHEKDPITLMFLGKCMKMRIVMSIGSNGGTYFVLRGVFFCVNNIQLLTLILYLNEKTNNYNLYLIKWLLGYYFVYLFVVLVLLEIFMV